MNTTRLPLSELIEKVLAGHFLSYDEYSFLVAVPHVKHKTINGIRVRLAGEDVYRIDNDTIAEFFKSCVYFRDGIWNLTEHAKRLTIKHT